MSSIYLFMKKGFSVTELRKLPRNVDMNILAITGEQADPIADPSFCKKMAFEN